MESNPQILDADLDIKPLNIESNVASPGKRIGNLIIDYLVIILICVIPDFYNAFFTNEPIFYNITDSPILLYFIYTTIFELLFGKTIGKFITKTRVVNLEGNKPGFIKIIGRNLCRIIPFDVFSFLGERAVGWHDKLSKTRVIND